MSLVKACILLFVGLLSVDGFYMNIPGEIYRRYIPIRDAPFMASVRFNSYRLCTGTIIHSQFILTTTYCVPESPSYYTVYLGVNEYNTLGITHRVATIIRNKRFSFGNDIALLKLTQTIIFTSTVQKIDIASDDLILNRDTKLKVLGWGQTKKIDSYNKLREISVSVISQSECRRKYKYLSTETFCTRNEGFCDGAEGGPAILDNVQVGVLTDKMSCMGSPQVYISLPPLRNWIFESIKLNL